MATSALERAFCSGCAVTYLLVAGFAGIALAGWPGAGWPEPTRAGGLVLGLLVASWLALLVPGTRTPQAAGEAGRAAIASAPPVGTAADGPLAEMIGGLEPALRHTDIRCGHCADLHRTLAQLRAHLPEGSFSVVSRQYPLDRACNATLRGEPRDPVRCLAARALICAEGQPGAFDYAGALFERQATLGADDVRALARQHVPQVEVEACLASPDTERELQEDIALAAAHGIDGTPLVLVNGRRGTSFGPFLYAVVLTGGAADHPAFAGLPSPDPRAHLH
jgi:serine/threonine-protein kinase